MSHLAVIGHILTDAGLHELLIIAYASNVVIRILRTKAIIARALQGHSLVYFEELPFKENINEQLVAFRRNINEKLVAFRRKYQ